jgi:3-hydroxybutyrate dehydrogenase
MPNEARILAGRSALVTGSTAGLGFAIADALARNGCNIVLNGLAGREEGEAARRDLEDRHGVGVLFDGADLSQPGEIQRMTEAASNAFGSLDIVVNNAVVRQFGPIEEMATSAWDRSLAVNLSAAFHLIRLALPGMREKGFGRIVNVSSIYGLIGTANRADYVTTKTALIGLTRAVALETAESGITCNAICPGTVPTPAITDKIRGMAASAGLTEEAATAEYLGTRQPTRRFIAPDGVAALVTFLCGDGGRDITGAALPIDGAWSIA